MFICRNTRQGGVLLVADAVLAGLRALSGMQKRANQKYFLALAAGVIRISGGEIPDAGSLDESMNVVPPDLPDPTEERA